MSAISIQQMADRVAALLEDRLSARGTGLEARLKSRGSALPRKVRAAAEQVAQAAAMAGSPKLLAQIDQAALARHYDICLRHLTPLRRRSRWLGGALAIAASIALSLLIVALILLAVMRWRGLI